MNLILLLTGLSFFILFAGYALAAEEPGEPFNPRQPVTSAGMPPVVVVSGSNYQMGYQYGRSTNIDVRTKQSFQS
jgi:hypothetical protein